MEDISDRLILLIWILKMKKLFILIYQFRYDLENCKLLEWDEEYVNPYVLDGTQWYVDILFKRNAPLRIEGSNVYPKTFDQLCSAISEIIQADFI